MRLFWADTSTQLYLGNAKNLDAIPDGTIDMAMVDAPYGIDYVTGHRDRSLKNVIATLERFDPIAGDEHFPRSLMHDAFYEIYRVLKEKTAVYIFTRWDCYHKLLPLVQEVFTVRNVLTWAKNNWCLSGDTKLLVRQKKKFVKYLSLNLISNWRDFEVYTPDGFKPIQRMEQTYTTAKRITVSGIPITASPEHIFPYHWDGSGYHGLPGIKELPAKSIEKGNLLWHPMLLEGKGHTYEDGWFVGFYLAEGYKIKNSRTGLRFVTGLHEGHHRLHIEDYAEAYGSVWHTLQEHNAITGVQSKKLREMIGHFTEGDKATNKELNMFSILNETSSDFRKGLIDGYCDGDGTLDGKRRRVTTSSQKLPEQIMVIASTIGLYSSKHSNGTSGFGSDNGTTIDLRANTGSQFWAGDKYLAKVTRTSSQLAQQPMYDLQVDGGIFCIYHGILTHNSAGDKEGNYAYQTEIILYATKGDHKLLGKRPTNLLCFKRVATNLLHPAQKPVELLSFLISKSCPENGVVLDPFLGCYDAQTEVLTKAGWKHFPEVKPNDEIATLNGKLEYQKPTHFYKYNYTGEMVKVAMNQVNLLVTPNHSIYAALRRYPDKKADWHFELLPATAIENKQHIYKKDAQWDGQEVKQFILSPVEIRGRNWRKPKYSSFNMSMDDFLKFFGLWLAEGNTVPKHKGYPISIRNEDTIILTELETILKRAECNPYWDSSFTRLSFNNKSLCLYLQPLGKAWQKYIPEEIKSLSARQLKILLDYYLKGDGWQDKCCWTTSKRLRDDIQEIALKVGWSANYDLQKPKTGQIRGRRVESKHPCWHISFIKNHNRPMLNSSGRSKVTRASYSGKVYCVEVPNHTLYVRREGKPVWCGNSGSTCVAATNIGRKSIGVDIDEKWLKLAQRRLEHKFLPMFDATETAPQNFQLFYEGEENA